MPRRELFRPQALLGQPSPLEWPGGRFWPGLPLPAVKFDMSCMPCCGDAPCCGIENATEYPTLNWSIVSECGAIHGASGTLSPSDTLEWTADGDFIVACFWEQLLLRCINGELRVVTVPQNADGCSFGNNWETDSVVCDPLQVIASTTVIEILADTCNCCDVGDGVSIVITEP